jgi:hypothetical protein
MDHCQHERRAGPKNSDLPTAALERVGLAARVRAGTRSTDDNKKSDDKDKNELQNAQLQRYFIGKGYLIPKAYKIPTLQISSQRYCHN